MNLDRIQMVLYPYFVPQGDKGELEGILKMIEEYAEEAYSDGFEQGWEENDLH